MNPDEPQNTKTFLRNLLQETWYLLVLMVVLLGVGIVSYIRTTQAPSPKPSVMVTPQPPQPERVATKDQSPVDTMRVATPEEETRNMMAENQQKYDTDPRSPDAPAYLCANGNLLLTRLKDYSGAIDFYERVLTNYPEYRGMLSVYLGLEESYKKLNKPAKLQWLYKQMMEKCDPVSAEHQYAKGKLGL